MVIWRICCCLFLLYNLNQVFSENGRIDVYATDGEIITLQCSNDRIDHWENVNKGLFVVYCNELKPSLRHFLTEACNLQMRVTVDDYNSTYRCVIGGNSPSFKDFKICMPTPPSSINITEVSSGHRVLGVEGHQMTLTCNVNSGTPRETIFWLKNGKVVLTGGPGRLQYTFVPEREDNFQNYTCTANNTVNSIAVREHIQLILTYKFSPNEINCTSVISITDSLTTTDQMHNGKYQENTSGITRREIVLGCALVCLLVLTIVLYARYRHYKTRNISIIEQHIDNTPTDQTASEGEIIHLYSTADDYSVNALPVVINDSMQGDDHALDSNSSISSSMDFDIEEDYIHPYDIPVYNSQDNSHEYEKINLGREYFTSINKDENEVEKSVPRTEIKSSSITLKTVQIGVHIVKSSSFKGVKICHKCTMENDRSITHIHKGLGGVIGTPKCTIHTEERRTAPKCNGSFTGLRWSI